MIDCHESVSADGTAYEDVIPPEFRKMRFQALVSLREFYT